MAFALFDWIREGVRQSVLQGVEEALAALGAAEGEPVRQHLARLRAASGPPPAVADAVSRPQRLGRRLRDALAPPGDDAPQSP